MPIENSNCKLCTSVRHIVIRIYYQSFNPEIEISLNNVNILTQVSKSYKLNFVPVYLWVLHVNFSSLAKHEMACDAIDISDKMDCIALLLTKCSPHTNLGNQHSLKTWSKPLFSYDLFPSIWSWIMPTLSHLKWITFFSTQTSSGSPPGLLNC